MSGHDNERQAQRAYDAWYAKVVPYSPPWQELREEEREPWRAVASAIYITLRKQNAELEAALTKARKRGFVNIVGESLCWEVTRDGLTSYAYGETVQDAMRVFLNSGFRVLEKDIKLSGPQDAGKPIGRNA